MKLKAMVIDDSRIMRTMVMQNLNKTRLAEFEFVEASDGADGIAKFNPKEIDIIFVDWNMPNMSGIEFVHNVRAMGKTENIQIVMVTSERTISKVEEALDKEGANAYICKPFTLDDLQKKLGDLITKIAANKQNSSGFFSKLLGGD